MMKPNIEKNRLYYETGVDRLSTYHLIYIIMLTLISVFEAAMIVRGVHLFDFSNFYLLVYFLSYVVLFSFSVLTVILLVYNQKRKNLYPLLYRMVDIYGGVILLWAFVISSIDVARGKTMIVFLTVIMVVAAVLYINVYLYSIFTGSFAICLIIQALRIGSDLIISSGYIINFTVFVAFSIVLCFAQSRLAVNAFASKKKLSKLSYYDQLTDVYNRHSLKEKIAKMSTCSIFYFGIVDLDNFKAVNDTYGHDVGDECLIRVARILQEHFGDRVYRYGGDEFIIISDFREVDLITHVNAINDALDDIYGDKNIHISAGFYCPVNESESYADYLKKADEALYEAKTTTKRRAVIYK